MTEDTPTEVFASHEWVGRTLESYRIMLEIGQGRHGVLFLGEEETTHESVAIKILYPGHTADIALANARILRALHHTGLTAVRSCGRSDEYVYIISEYVRFNEGDVSAIGSGNGVFGKNLLEYIETRSELLDEKDVTDILTQILDVIQYVHGVNDSETALPHGGLHPQNVLLQKRNDGTLKVFLTDIGLPCTRARHTDMDMYISPEELQGKGATHHSDIYSLGALAYVLLTGVAPGTPLVPPTDIRTDVSAGWDTLIRRSLAYEPLERISDYQAFRIALLHLKKRMTHRLTFSAIRYALGALCVIVLISLSIFLLVQLREGRDIRALFSRDVHIERYESDYTVMTDEDDTFVRTIERMGTPSVTDLLDAQTGVVIHEASPGVVEEQVHETTPAVTDVVEESIVTEAPRVTDETPPVEEKISPERYATYTVQRGDTYYNISRRAGMSIDALCQLNQRTTTDVLRVGETLRIPVDSSLATVDVARVSAPDTQERVSPPSDTDTREYIVQRGDTYFGLARRGGIPVATLQELNNNVPLQVGMTIRVPASSSLTNVVSGAQDASR